jgi:phage shock protein A
MNDQVPRMNDSIAMVKANQTLLEKEEAKYKTEVADLTAKVRAAIQGGRDDLAGAFATQLESTRSALARTQGQLSTASAAFEKALNVKKAFLREKDRKTHEAMNAIRDYRRAQWQKKVADAMEQFEVGGISQTHDDMVRKIANAESLLAPNLGRHIVAVDNQGDPSVVTVPDADHRIVSQYAECAPVLPVAVRSPVQVRPAVHGLAEGRHELELHGIHIELPGADRGSLGP